MVTKVEIVEMLKTNDKAVARALVALTARQTADEQSQETVKYQNGQGFRPCHARMGTSMANFYSRAGFLTVKQVAYWRKLDKSGKMRIEIYAGQLLIVAQAKAATKAILAPKKTLETMAAEAALEQRAIGDVGNMQEEIMVLEERLGGLRIELGQCLDSDDDRIIGNAVGNIEDCEERIAMLRKECARAYAEMSA